MATEKPPIVELVLAEGLHKLTSAAELRQRLMRRGLLHELQQQAEYSVSQWGYASPSHRGEFVAVPGGALNPFSYVAKCNSDDCRLKAASAFARSLALYADRVVIPDVFTSIMLTAERVRPENEEQHFDELHKDLIVLRELLPLVQHGTIEFSAPTHDICLQCSIEADQYVADAMQDVTLRVSREALHVHKVYTENGHHKVDISCSLLTSATGHELIFEHDVSPSSAIQVASLLKGKRGKAHGVLLPPRVGGTLREEMERTLVAEVQPIIFSLLASDGTGAVLAAGSQLEGQFLRRVESSSCGTRLAEVDAWEMTREVHLPAVSMLTMEEVLRLKDEASTALPALRELLARRLGEHSTEPSETRLAKTISELRSQAPAVKAELDGWARSSAPRLEKAVVSAAFSLVLYSMANPIAAPTALVAVLGALYAVHAAKTKEIVETEKLKAQPAYVVVKAREILQRRRRVK
jgi:hypothetical protein